MQPEHFTNRYVAPPRLAHLAPTRQHVTFSDDQSLLFVGTSLAKALENQ